MYHPKTSVTAIFSLIAISISVNLVAFENEGLSSADPKLWKKHFSAGTEALRKNDQKAAFNQFNLALADSEGFTGRDTYKKVETLSELGALLLQSGEYENAVVLLKQALALWSVAEKSKEIERAELLMELASAYKFAGKYTEAEECAQEGIKILETKVGRYKPQTALATAELGMIYSAMKKFPEAEGLFTEALKTVQSPQYKTAMESDGSVRVYRYRPLQNQIANTQNNFAAMYQDWGKFDQAEALFKESLSSEEAEFGKEHLNTLTPLVNLTLITFRRKDFTAAGAYGKHALHVAEKAIGLGHPQGFSALARLAAIYYRDAKRSDYELLVGRILKIESENHSRPLLTSVMMTAAFPEMENSDWVGVEQIYKRFLPEFEVFYGKDDPRDASGLDILQRFYATHNRKEESDQLYSELLIRKAKATVKR